MKQIGSFIQLFDKEVLYLSLLKLRNAEKAILTVQKAIQESTNLEKEIKILLEDIDWRPHLVACTALLMIHSTNFINDLWKTFDRGSWVNPQLAVVAYFYDNNFSQNAKERLDKRCLIQFELTEPISTLEFHIATGGSGSDQISRKSMASLMALCATIPSLVSYISELSTSEDVKKMLEEDWDKAELLTQEWLREITLCFNKLGIILIRSENKQHFTNDILNILWGIKE